MPYPSTSGGANNPYSVYAPTTYPYTSTQAATTYMTMQDYAESVLGTNRNLKKGKKRYHRKRNRRTIRAKARWDAHQYDKRSKSLNSLTKKKWKPVSDRPTLVLDERMIDTYRVEF